MSNVGSMTAELPINPPVDIKGEGGGWGTKFCKRKGKVPLINRLPSSTPKVIVGLLLMILI